MAFLHKPFSIKRGVK